MVLITTMNLVVGKPVFSDAVKNNPHVSVEHQFSILLTVFKVSEYAADLSRSYVLI